MSEMILKGTLNRDKKTAKTHTPEYCLIDTTQASTEPQINFRVVSLWDLFSAYSSDIINVGVYFHIGQNRIPERF